MKQLILDGAAWTSKDEVYDAFFKAVGAPSWHGRNLDALDDSIKGGIKSVEVPYRSTTPARFPSSGKRDADAFLTALLAGRMPCNNPAIAGSIGVLRLPKTFTL